MSPQRMNLHSAQCLDKFNNNRILARVHRSFQNEDESISLEVIASRNGSIYNCSIGLHHTVHGFLRTLLNIKVYDKNIDISFSDNKNVFILHYIGLSDLVRKNIKRQNLLNKEIRSTSNCLEVTTLCQIIYRD